ncbi:Fibronectin type III domain-containing protein [Chitinophaga rupis]|uniref:Fibronectin type III domain-containing protein n=1 Tax=Chitinophaga rupis TaxID=573321 RepID=A0A1H8A9F0_9BACT|nr:fibronectin type III domain-containing protein [Chitinophaga rupis]SEM66167.1 Fibronectin type III domain-containing protein [Chitinophaga rupis]
MTATRFIQIAVSILLLFVLCQPLAAQQYPVRVQVQTLQPVSAQLSNLYSGTQARMIVTLLNTDLQKPVLQVRLRLNIKGTTVALRNRDYGSYPLISLEAGIPVQLSLNDLAPYFNIDNMEVSGVPRQQLQQSGKLPDGFYNFCIEVVELNSGQLVSNDKLGCAPPVWISTSEPPLLNLPRKGEAVSFRDPLNIVFNWTPRHMGSPNAAFQTEYEFTLVEIWDTGILPEAAFSTTPPLYQTTTASTTLLYGPAEPPLLPGKRYAWRIRAKAKQGIDEFDVFTNNGYTEIFYFTLQEDCAPPQQPVATVQDGRITITWLPQPKMFEYLVEYREQGKDNAEWFNVKTTSSEVTIYDAVPGRKYDYRVGGYCTLGNKTLGDVHGFTVPSRDTTANRNCGLLPDIKLTNQTALQELQPDDQIMAGDFPVRLLQVRGAGSFTGYGYITIPFLGYNRLKVKFDNIRVNTDRQLMSGVIMSTFDSLGTQIVDVDNIMANLLGIINSLGKLITDQQSNPVYGDNVQQGVKDLEEEVENLIAAGKISDTTSAKELIQQLEAQTSPANTDNDTKAKASGTLQKLKELINQDNSTTGANTTAAAAAKKNYFTFNTIRFNSGDTVYLPKSNQQYEIKAFLANGKPVRKGAVWTGQQHIVDSATVKYAPGTTSLSLAGSLIRVIDSVSYKTDSTKKAPDTLTVNIVTVEISFSQDATQVYGFDENDSTKEECYPSYKNTTPKKGLMWKAINGNSTNDYVQIKVTPAGAENKVKFILSDSITFSVTPRIPTAATQTLTLKGTVVNKETALIPRVGAFTNDTMQMKVKSYKKITKKVKVIRLIESNDDIQLVAVGDTTHPDSAVVAWGANKFLDSKLGGDDRVIYRRSKGDSVIVAGPNRTCDTKANNINIVSHDLSRATIQTTLDKIYTQGVVEWQVDATSYTKTMNYDFNRDSMIDVSRWTSAEMQAIIDTCDTKDGSYNIFLVDNPDDHSNGFMGMGQRFGFIHIGKMPGHPAPTDAAKTVGHEIGHGAFRFQHPHSQFPGCYPPRGAGAWAPKDINNLMDWDGGWLRDLIRKYQWDEIVR